MAATQTKNARTWPFASRKSATSCCPSPTAQTAAAVSSLAAKALHRPHSWTPRVACSSWARADRYRPPLAKLKAKTGNGVYVTAPVAANTGAAWISAGSVSSPSALQYPAAPNTTPPQYTVNFTVSAGVTTYTVLKDGGGTALSNVPYQSSKSIDIDGMSFSISGQPADTDTFTIDQSNNNLSVFDALDSAISSLNTANLNSGQVSQTVNRGLSNLDSILGNVAAARSAVGESLNRMDGIESRISSSTLAAQNERSSAEDLDMVQGISNFQNQQSSYDAALKSYAMVQKLTLFQYING
jgi:flagellar hook-associated protein 3 FlgL